MGTTMSSKERVLMAIDCREPDHIPLLNRDGIPYRYWLTRRRDDRPFRDQYERVVETLKLGIDDAVAINPPFHLNDGIKIRIREARPPTEKYPLLTKVYETPKGSLSKVVRKTPDWPHGDDIPLFDDYGVSRSVKNWVENEGDLDVLSYLFREPTEDELETFQEEAEHIGHFSEEHEVPIMCVEDAKLGSAAMWLCGFINVIKYAIKNQEFLHRLLDIIHEWDMLKTRYLVEYGGADVVVHYGWYDSTDFWSMKAYRTFLLPRLREEIEFVHGHKAKFGYTMASGAMPLLKTFREMDIDLLYGVDPIQGGYDLLRTKKDIGDRICLWGGVNSHITLTLGDRHDVTAAVSEAFSNLAPGGGFILSSVGTMSYSQIPMGNIEAMIEAWRGATAPKRPSANAKVLGGNAPFSDPRMTAHRHCSGIDSYVLCNRKGTPVE